jgi:hypothetical protein
MDESRVKVITEWPKLRFFRDIQVFLNFANFYRRFIRDYSRIAASLTSIFKGNVNGRKIDLFKFKEVVRAAFKLLKAFFIRASILIYFNPNKPIKIEIDISEFAIARILSQSINKQSMNNVPVYKKLKSDDPKNLDSGRLSHLTIKKKSKYFQIY